MRTFIVSAPTGPIEIDGSMPEYNPLPGFRVDDGDPGASASKNEDDILQATVRLLDKNGVPFVKKDYEAGRGITIEYFPLPDIAVHKVHRGRKDYLTIRGAMAQINIALAGLAIVLQSDHDQCYALQVIVENCPPPMAEPLDKHDWYYDSVPEDDPAVDLGSVVILALSTPDRDNSSASSDPC